MSSIVSIPVPCDADLRGDIPVVSLIAALSYALGGVPKEYRRAVTAEFIPGDSEWGSAPEISLSYRRPKTTEEIAAEVAERRAEAKRCAQQREVAERQALAALLAKYGAPST